MRSILITGGSNGIGQALVREYLKLGYMVYNLDKVSPSIEDDHLVFFSCDLSDVSQVREAFEQVGKIDVLIGNAASFDQNDFLKQSIEEVMEVVNVNLHAHILLSQLYAKQFQGNHGRIVFLSSTRAYMSEENTVGYSVSKGGLNALTHSLAITLQEKHITVNAIAPGWINSHEEDLRNIDHNFHPSKRVGRVEDIVRTCVFLTDQKADFINGEVITVDGGVTKKMMYPEESND